MSHIENFAKLIMRRESLSGKVVTRKAHHYPALSNRGVFFATKVGKYVFRGAHCLTRSLGSNAVGTNLRRKALLVEKYSTTTMDDNGKTSMTV